MELTHHFNLLLTPLSNENGTIVIPAQAGIHVPKAPGFQLPAGARTSFAGMTEWGPGMVVEVYFRDNDVVAYFRSNHVYLIEERA